MFILGKQKTILDISFQSILHLSIELQLCGGDLVDGVCPDLGLPNWVFQLHWIMAWQGGGQGPSPDLTSLGFRLLIS